MQITDSMEWRSRKEETGMRDTARQMRSAMMCDRMRQMSMCDGMDADVVRAFPGFFRSLEEQIDTGAMERGLGQPHGLLFLFYVLEITF